MQNTAIWKCYVAMETKKMINSYVFEILSTGNLLWASFVVMRITDKK